MDVLLFKSMFPLCFVKGLIFCNVNELELEGCVCMCVLILHLQNYPVHKFVT
jgi:hypothetical protein